MILIRFLTGPLAGREAIYDYPRISDVARMDPEGELEQIAAHGWAWRVILDFATPSERHEWLAADAAMRVLRACDEDRLVYFKGSVLEQKYIEELLDLIRVGFRTLLATRDDPGDGVNIDLVPLPVELAVRGC